MSGCVACKVSLRGPRSRLYFIATSDVYEKEYLTKDHRFLNKQLCEVLLSVQSNQTYFLGVWMSVWTFQNDENAQVENANNTTAH